MIDSNELNFLEFISSEYEKIQMLDEEKLGIPSSGFMYHHVSENQYIDEEFKKTEEFLNWVLTNHPHIFDEVYDIKFIKYK